jgi:DNA polymerase-3 subunit gamma/tau
MSYLVLARKYRPRTFADVVGQEVLTRTLQGAIREDRVGHAYLFCGPRGTGKTTTARIFAKALNCARGPLPDPCGECERCLAIDSGNDVDVVEIDAASHTGVDNIRDLREKAAYAPMGARFKVYIIDEVHMLSKGAFNALLKTLEEPPPHVKFLFATTEPEKVPDTILSRCQLLKLGLFREEVIATLLEKILSTEGVEASEGVTPALARLARGSMRDALSITDQLLALVGSRPTLEDVHRMAGPSNLERVESLLAAIEQGDRALLFETLGPEQGGEAELADELLRSLRGSIVCALCGPESKLFSDFEARRESLAARAQRLGTERIQIWMEELLACRERMEGAFDHARLILELTLLDLCREESSLPLAELEQRLLTLEGRLSSGADVLQPRPKPESKPPSQPVPAPAPAPTPAPSPATAPAQTGPAVDRQPAAAPEPPRARGPGRAGWEDFLARLKTQEPALARVFERCGRLVEAGESQARVRMTRLRDDDRGLLDAPESRAAWERAFAQAYGREMVIVVEDTAKRQPGASDAFTRQVADLFSGHIEENQ